MNLYLIERTDKVQYDEYDAVVSAGNTEQEALELSSLHHYTSLKFTIIGTSIDDIPGQILGSFNAG